MLHVIEALKDTLQTAVDQGTTRVERIHEMVVDYVEQNADAAGGPTAVDRKSIYDLVRAINREIGDMATDVFEMIEDAERAIAVRAEERERIEDRSS
jgi:phosphate uptake regulator